MIQVFILYYLFWHIVFYFFEDEEQGNTHKTEVYIFFAIIMILHQLYIFVS